VADYAAATSQLALSHSVPVAAITISIVGKLLIVLNFIFD
jgi:hypothetical protein